MNTNDSCLKYFFRMNNYHLYEEIGHGKLSTVYKGRRRGTIEYVAIKSVDKSKRARVMTEVAMSASISSSPHLCHLLNWYETRNHLWTVSEYCAGGDLSRILKQDIKLPELNVLAVGSQILQGLLELHEAGIIFADMKPGNVLFVEDGSVKLSGFAVSQKIADLESALAENKPVPRRGSPFYMAPELFRDSGFHSFASDIWGLGIVLFEMISGNTPFSACTSFQELQRTITSTRPVVSVDACSASLSHLLSRMLDKDPSTRIGWHELVTHPWWNGTDLQNQLVKIPQIESKFDKYFKPSPVIRE